MQIQFNGVQKSYGPGNTAVKNLTFEVQKGEIFTLLGPSGCGKTTTLRLLAGFEKPDHGGIFIAGRVVADSNCWIPPEARGVGMVFQNYALFPHMNIESNVAFGLRGMSKSQRMVKAREYIELVGLLGYEKRYPHEISGGQQQRVALARALCPEPAVVLLDEPFSNLDNELREHMRGELKRIIEITRATAVLVTHDQKDALAISDRIMVMHQGTVQQVGEPRTLYLRPTNQFVAFFLGKANLFPGRITEDGMFVETEIGKVPFQTNQRNTKKDLVMVSIRPEGFQLAEDGPITGIIKTVHYLGNELECWVELPQKNKGPEELLISLDPQKKVTPGDSVSIHIRPESVVLLPN